MSVSSTHLCVCVCLFIFTKLWLPQHLQVVDDRDTNDDAVNKKLPIQLQSEFHSEDLLRGPRAAQNPPLGSNCHQDQSSAPRRVLRIQYHHILLPGHQRPNYHHHHHHHQDFNFRAVLVRVCSFSIFTIPPFWVNRCTVETTPLKGRKLTFQAVLQMILNPIFRSLREELVVRKGEIENWKRCLETFWDPCRPSSVNWWRSSQITAVFHEQSSWLCHILNLNHIKTNW